MTEHSSAATDSGSLPTSHGAEENDRALDEEISDSS